MFKNEVSYSYSKAKMLGECPLRYYRYTYASWGGWWNRSKPPKDKAAEEHYSAKFVETIPSWIGKLVHKAAEEGLRLSMEGRRWKDRDQLLEHLMKTTRSRFDHQLDQALNVRVGNPKTRLQLREALDGEDIDVDDVWNKIDDRLSALLADDGAWSGLTKNINLYWRAINRPKSIIMVEELVSFRYAGIKVWVVNDLVMRSSSDSMRCVIVDWKTGRKKSLDVRQISLYGAWAQRSGWNGAEAVLVYLRGGETQVDRIVVTDDMIAEARASIDLFVEDLRGRLVDGDIRRNEPIPDAFEPTEDASQCTRCMFRRVCEREGTKPWQLDTPAQT